MTHLERYGKAYIVGAIFILVAIANAIVGEFGEMTAAQEQAMTRFQWFTSVCSVTVSAGNVILAFLNNTASNAQSANRAEIKTDTVIATKP